MRSENAFLTRLSRRHASFALVAVALLMALFLHAPLLQGAASFLVSGDEASSGEFIVVLGGDSAYDEAARLIDHAGWNRILIVQTQTNRLMDLGILPPADEVALKELQSRGVPRDRIKVIAGKASNDWEIVRQLISHLETEKAAESLILCDRFSSRRLRRIIKGVTVREQAKRISLTPLRDRRYDETNWWKSRTGVKQFCTHLGTNLLLTIVGECHCQNSSWDPDEFEQDLANRFASPEKGLD